MQLTRRCAALLLSIGALVLALFHVLYVSRAEHRFRIKECFAMLWDANVPEFAIICAVVITATVLFFREISSSGELIAFNDVGVAS